MEAKDLYVENYEALLKERKENVNKLKGKLVIKRFNIKMTIVCKAFYRFDAFPVKNSSLSYLFYRNRKLILQFA